MGGKGRDFRSWPRSERTKSIIKLFKDRNFFSGPATGRVPFVRSDCHVPQLSYRSLLRNFPNAAEKLNVKNSFGQEYGRPRSPILRLSPGAIASNRRCPFGWPGKFSGNDGPNRNIEINSEGPRLSARTAPAQRPFARPPGG